MSKQVKNTLKSIAAGIAIACAAAAAPAQAGTASFFFDPTGTGTFTGPALGSFDFTPGNALAVGAVPLTNTATAFNLYAQSALGSFILADGSGTASLGDLGGAGHELTYQGILGETGVATSSTAAEFTSTGGSFSLFYGTTNRDVIAGTGYGDGTMILSGSVTPGDLSTFTVDSTKPLTNLDGFGADNQHGVQTVTGAGGGQIRIGGLTFDPNYIRIEGDPAALLVSLFFNTSFITPFNQTNPSNAVVGQTPYYSQVPNGLGGFTAVNGITSPSATCQNENGGTRAGPCDFHFQADANGSFVVATVPEPGTVALLGLGLAGFGFLRMRRK
jgi:hypothetical protein